MQPVRLEHALLDIRELRRSLPFYQSLLPEWVVRWEGSTMEGHHWVHFGPAEGEQPGYLSLYELPGADNGKGPAAANDAAGGAASSAAGGSGSASAAGDGPANASDALRIEHIGFAHPDVRGLVARMVGLGVDPSDTVDDGRYRRAYFVDPDGHQLEFVQKL